MISAVYCFYASFISSRSTVKLKEAQGAKKKKQAEAVNKQK